MNKFLIFSPKCSLSGGGHESLQSILLSRDFPFGVDLWCYTSKVTILSTFYNIAIDGDQSKQNSRYLLNERIHRNKKSLLLSNGDKSMQCFDGSNRILISWLLLWSFKCTHSIYNLVECLKSLTLSKDIMCFLSMHRSTTQMGLQSIYGCHY